MPTSIGEPGGVVVVADGAVLPCWIGVAEGVFSFQRVQVVIVLVINSVFTTVEVVPLITTVEVTGQLVKVV